MLNEGAVVDWFTRTREITGISADDAEIRRAHGEFQRVYRERPLANNVGGIGPNPSLWLFLIAKLLDPKLIIESGVWRGHSSWLLRQACPQAELHAFDLNLEYVVVRERSITYHEMDWSRHQFMDVDPRRSLIFFDDHVNQCRRIRESHEKGFTFLLLDDNMPARETASTGVPPFPTLQMLFDPEIAFGDAISWKTVNDRTKIYTYKKKDTFDAGRVIDEYFIFPGTPCHLTFVKLKERKNVKGGAR